MPFTWGRDYPNTCGRGRILAQQLKTDVAVYHLLGLYAFPYCLTFCCHENSLVRDGCCRFRECACYLRSDIPSGSVGNASPGAFIFIRSRLGTRCTDAAQLHIEATCRKTRCANASVVEMLIYTLRNEDLG